MWGCQEKFSIVGAFLGTLDILMIFKKLCGVVQMHILRLVYKAAPQISERKCLKYR